MSDHPKRYSVKEVIDLNTGKISPAELVLGLHDSEHHQQRLRDETEKLREGAVRYHCALCVEPLSIRGLPDQSYYFRHPDNPGAQCPYRHGSSLSVDQINAMKYDGAKESARHQDIKDKLLQSLQADRRINPDSVHLEKRVRSASADWKEWRQPDVQARIDGRLFAFEIQLSTTFLTVIAGRREFYLRNGAILFWIFDGQAFDETTMRFTEKDVYFNNNRNLFYVNSRTVRNSFDAGECRLMCRWEEPVISNGAIVYVWREQEVGLSELTIDMDNQRVYFFDFDRFEAQAIARLNTELADRQARENPTQQIDDEEWRTWDELDDDNSPEMTELDRFRAQRAQERAAFRAALIARYSLLSPDIDTVGNFGYDWVRAGMEAECWEAQCAIWSHFYPELKKQWSQAPEELTKQLANLLNCLYSLREGVVVGSRLQNLRALENHIYTHYRQFYRYFAFGIRCYRRERPLASLEPGSTCFRHLKEYKSNVGKAGFIQDRGSHAIVLYLFSELAALDGKQCNHRHGDPLARRHISSPL